VPQRRRFVLPRAGVLACGAAIAATATAAAIACAARATATPPAFATPASAGGAAYPPAGPSGRPLYPLPAPPIQPEPCPPPPGPPVPTPPPLGPARVPENAVPIVRAPRPRRADLAAVSGKGIWLTLWPGATIDPARVVALARAARLHQLWLRTSSSHAGYYGGPMLRALLPAAHAAGVAVIAWGFPTLSDPAADARSAADALRDGADGFAADIESPAEGTYLTARRVAYYLSLVRAATGGRPLVAVVPRPTSYWLATYPYGTEAQFVDVFAPMVYWSCIEPGAAVSSAIADLARLRPVAPIGQDYNMASEGGRHGLPSGREIWRFLDVARRTGAVGASLFDLEAGGRPQLAALGGYPW
jgi:hypothetical protein